MTFQLAFLLFLQIVHMCLYFLFSKEGTVPHWEDLFMMHSLKEPSTYPTAQEPHRLTLSYSIGPVHNGTRTRHGGACLKPNHSGV